MSAGLRRLPWRASAALAMIGALFWVGAWVYVHVGGLLLRQAAVLPAPLLLSLALVGGAASFFSPCSIAITPSFLVYLLGDSDAAAVHVERRRVIGSAGVVALGIVSFYALAGLLIGLVGAVAYNYLVYLILVVGIAFVALGYALLSGAGARTLGALATRNPANQAYDDLLERGGVRGARLYGFGWVYGAASHSCALPIFLGIVLVPLATGALWLAVATTLA